MIADFSFAPTQTELQRAARRLFADRSPITVVRQVEETEDGYQRDLWSEMALLGWIGMALPLEHGGGGEFLDLYALTEEMGRFLVPSPLLDVLVGAEILSLCGDTTQRSAILERIADGTCIISVMIADAAGQVGESGVGARETSAGWHLSGTCPLVAYASSADYLLCAARTPRGDARIFLVDRHSPGVAIRRLANIAGLPLFEVTLSDVVVGSEWVIGDPGDGPAALLVATTKAAVLQTAYIVGAAHTVLEMTNQYAKDRLQFGAPIGKNQAVQYMVSDVLIDLHTVDLLGRQAAYRITAGLPYEREAEIAIIHGKVAAAHLHRQAHEVHAGVGFMLEHSLNVFSRRSKYLENNFGDARFHYEQLARLMCDGQERTGAGIA
jgi:3-oxocholest-4-en-26-oyl-CoA dehydrogenase beta subunit